MCCEARHLPTAAARLKPFAAALTALLLFFSGCKAGDLPDIKLESINKPENQTNTPCLNKELCLVAYLTPWCPSCKASVDYVQALRKKLENRPKVGLMVIIGQDGRPAILSFSKQLRGQVFVDDENKFTQAARFSSVPHWWIIDKERKIKNSGAGFPGSSDDKVVDYFIEEEYGMKELL